MFSEVLSGQVQGKLVVGDCLEVMPNIPDKSVDMILCDLPYGTTACKWDTIIPFEPLWKQYKRIIKDHGAIVLTATQPFTSMLVMSNLEWFKYEIIWEKERPTNILFMKNRIGKVHENVLIFYKRQPTYNPQMMPRPGKHSIREASVDLSKIDTNRHLTHPNQPKYKISKDYNPFVIYPRSVLRINRDLGKKTHPTQKPVLLFEYLIKTYTKENELVLDNCIGSGTTAIAAIRTGRKWIGIELDPEYVKLAQERIDREVAEIDSRLF